jgi:hypothetical protein
MEICTCHYKENIEWLKSSLYPVTVVHKEGGDPFSHESFFHSFTVPNIGVEAYAYLSYILDR